jgi:hypothetical protein
VRFREGCGLAVWLAFTSGHDAGAPRGSPAPCRRRRCAAVSRGCARGKHLQTLQRPVLRRKAGSGGENLLRPQRGRVVMADLDTLEPLAERLRRCEGDTGPQRPLLPSQRGMRLRLGSPVPQGKDQLHQVARTLNQHRRDLHELVLRQPRLADPPSLVSPALRNGHLYRRSTTRSALRRRTCSSVRELPPYAEIEAFTARAARDFNAAPGSFSDDARGGPPCGVARRGDRFQVRFR